MTHQDYERREDYPEPSAEARHEPGCIIDDRGHDTPCVTESSAEADADPGSVMYERGWRAGNAAKCEPSAEADAAWYEIAMLYRQSLEAVERQYPGTLTTLAQMFFTRGMDPDLNTVERNWRASRPATPPLDVERLARALGSAASAGWVRLLAKYEWNDHNRIAPGFARDMAASIAREYAALANEETP